MKTSIILRIVFYALTILILTGILISVLAFRLYSFSVSDGTTELRELSTQWNPSEIDSLEINWAAGDILLQSADVASIQISESGGETQMQLTQSGSTLRIDYDQHFKLSQKRIPSKDLTVLVPQSWRFEQLDINSAASTILLQELTVSTASFAAASGEITFRNCTVEMLECNSASADLHFSGNLGTLRMDGASANASLILSDVPDSLEMNAFSGNLEITLPEDAGFTVDKTSFHGSLRCDFDVHNTDSRIICGNGKCSIRFSAMSGDLAIHKHQPDHHHK